MRQYFLILFLISATLCIAQIPAEITLHDGTIFEGFADITSKDKIEFRITLEDTPETFDEIDIIGVVFLEEPFGRYEYVKTKNKFRLLKVVSNGDITAYAQYPETFSTQKTKGQLKREDYINHDDYNFFSNGISTNPTGSFSFRKRRFWLKKSGIIFIEDIKVHFRREARIWFKNCPKLLDKIKKRELVYNDMEEIVNYYNDFCGTY